MSDELLGKMDGLPKAYWSDVEEVLGARPLIRRRNC